MNVTRCCDTLTAVDQQLVAVVICTSGPEDGGRGGRDEITGENQKFNIWTVSPPDVYLIYLILYI